MSSAFDLGISEQEALDAVNLEKLYGIIKKARFCSKCSNPPTHVDFNSLQLLCGAHAVGKSCKRIGEDRFTLIEIQKLQRKYNDISLPLRSTSHNRAKSISRHNAEKSSRKHSNRRAKSSRRRKHFSSTSEDSEDSWGEDEFDNKHAFSEGPRPTPRSKQQQSNKSNDQANFAFGFEDNFKPQPTTPQPTSTYPPGMAGILMHKQQQEHQRQQQNKFSNDYYSGQNYPEYPVPFQSSFTGEMSQQPFVNPSYIYSQRNISMPPHTQSYYSTPQCPQNSFQFQYEPQQLFSQTQDQYLNRPVYYQANQKLGWPTSSGPQSFNNQIISKPQGTNPFASATESAEMAQIRPTIPSMQPNNQFILSKNFVPFYPGCSASLFQQKKDSIRPFGTDYSAYQQPFQHQLQSQQLMQLQHPQQPTNLNSEKSQSNSNWQSFNSYPLYNNNTSTSPNIPRITAVQKDWWD